jgi:hypothetical protein
MGQRFECDECKVIENDGDSNWGAVTYAEVPQDPEEEMDGESLDLCPACYVKSQTWRSTKSCPRNPKTGHAADCMCAACKGGG